MEKEVRAYVLMLLLPVIWGGNFVFGKVLVEAMPPWTLATVRWLVALIFLLPLTIEKEGLRALAASAKHWKLILLMAIPGVTIFNSVVYAALQYTSPVNASLVGTASPAVIAFLAWVFLKEKITPLQITGLIISAVGVVWVLSRGSLQTILQLKFNYGDMIMFFNVFSWGIYSIALKRGAQYMSPLVLTTVNTLVGVLFLLPLSWLELQSGVSVDFSWQLVLGGLYLGLFASVLAFLLWTEGTRILGASRTGVFLNLVPVFAALEGYLFFNQAVTQGQLVGGMIVFVGVYLTSAKYTKTMVN